MTTSRWVLALSLVGACPGTRAADANATKVILDRSTFGLSARVLGAIADKVAVDIDRLIPGRITSSSEDGIVCYVGSGDAPVTLVGARQAGEPEAVRANTVRIAVNRKVLPSSFAEFVFELAHELAHAKMDARYDNYLVETFAVAVSLRVLEDVGSLPARQANIVQYTAALPAGVQSALEDREWETARAYWQSQIPKQAHSTDYSFAFLGALLLDGAGQPVWRQLLNAAELSEDCKLADGRHADEASAAEFKTCRPAIARLGKLEAALRALGYSFYD